MQWTQSDTLALARQGCPFCKGFGLKKPKRGTKKRGKQGLPIKRRGPRGPRQPCNCVLRKIFHICYDHYRHCVAKEKFMSRVSLTPRAGKENMRSYERLDEDYIADFTLVSRRTLSEGDRSIFDAHFLLAADWRLCCRLLKVERGDFFHAVYRIKRQLGRVFRELEPYGLYPLDEYFGGTFSRKRLSVELPSGAAVDAAARPVNGVAAGVVASTNRRLVFPRPPIRVLTPKTSSSNKRAD